MTEAMDAIEAEFASFKSTDDVASALQLHDELTAWLDEQIVEIYQKSIGADQSGHAADVATFRANLNSILSS